jgi:sugar lactone lactonase YvrE
MTATAARAALAGVLLLPVAAPAEELWTISGVSTPESVLFDGRRDILYVANIAGDPVGKDGNGYLSILDPDGGIRIEKWVTGFDAPKGLFLDGDTLYVSDIDRLVAIDVAEGAVAGSWAADGAIFLNDIAADDAGRVFVSDMLADRIYVLEDGTLSVWLQDAALEHPNGLAVADGRLVVATWGPGLKEDFTTEAPGRLLTIDLDSKAIAPFGSGAGIGNLDGLEPDGDGGWIVTDWIAGGVIRVAPDGSAEMLIDLGPGSADLEFLPDERVAIVPMMLDDGIVSHRLD